MAGCQRDNVFAPGGDESIGNDEKRVGALLGKRRKSRIDLAASAGIENKKLFARACVPRFCTSSNCSAASARVGFTKYSDQCRLRNQARAAIPVASPSDSADQEIHARDVAARPVEAGDEAEFHRDQRRS